LRISSINGKVVVPKYLLQVFHTSRGADNAAANLMLFAEPI